jgi:hypothetical protein
MFLYRGIKYNIFGLIPKTSYVTQTLNIKYHGTIEPRVILEILNLTPPPTRCISMDILAWIVSDQVQVRFHK